MYEQIARNKRRTILLLIIFGVLIAAVALAVNYFIGLGVIGLVIALVIAIALCFGSYYNSDKVALKVSGAKPAESPDYQQFHNLIEGLCIAAGLPKPRLYVVDDPAPNAFSTGRNPKHAAVCVTTGLLQTMNRVELEGVLAHELSHIKNYDILVATVAVTAAGALVILSDIAIRMMWFTGRGRDRDNSGGSIVGVVLLVVSLVTIILAPIGAQIMQFAVSRRREYLADASGVQLTRYPPGLISALEKLQNDQAVIRHRSRATSQLWIEQPNDTKPQAKGSFLNRAFDTHPPLEDRIKALKEM